MDADLHTEIFLNDFIIYSLASDVMDKNGPLNRIIISRNWSDIENISGGANGLIN